MVKKSIQYELIYCILHAIQNFSTFSESPLRNVLLSNVIQNPFVMHRNSFLKKVYTYVHVGEGVSKWHWAEFSESESMSHQDISIKTNGLNAWFTSLLNPQRNWLMICHEIFSILKIDSE